MKNNKFWFTMVEVITVTTLLIILWTIAFISYSTYLIWVRDTSRLTQLEMLSKWLEIYSSEHLLPYPQDKIEIRARWEVIWWQGYLWDDAFRVLNFNANWVDPADKILFSYYITKDRKYFQVMWQMEDKANLPNFWIQEIQAVDYTLRTPIILGDKLWLLTDEFNTPLHQLEIYKLKWYVDLTTEDKDTLFIANIENLKSFKFSWEILSNKLYTLSKPWRYSPKKWCPDWFISVWWDVEFNQRWFCVAQYEMTYSENDTTWTPSFWTHTTPSSSSKRWATYNYDSTKKIKSRSDYPISNISQSWAIDACESLWRWYHLITNNEWMTIARNIEFEAKNWSNKENENSNLNNQNKDSWFIFNWNSWNSTSWIYWCDSTWYYDWTYNEWWNKTWESSTEIGCDLKRSSSLFSWDIIWDFAWNLWEHVNKSNTIKAWVLYYQWTTTIWSSNWFTWWESWSITSLQKENYWPKQNLETDNWIGQIYRWNWTSSNVLVRGWSSWDGESTWIYSIDLWLNKDSMFENVWFRCAK